MPDALLVVHPSRTEYDDDLLDAVLDELSDADTDDVATYVLDTAVIAPPRSAREVFECLSEQALVTVVGEEHDADELLTSLRNATRVLAAVFKVHRVDDVRIICGQYSGDPENPRIVDRVASLLEDAGVGDITIAEHACECESEDDDEEDDGEEDELNSDRE